MLPNKVQKQIIDDYASIMSDQISMKKMVIKDFFWRASREWQKIHKMTILDTEKDSQSTPDERIKQASEILNLCKLELKSLVKDGPETLENSFNDALNHYIKNYANG